ncbi:S24 family peptidase [Psittacicella hinzii]|uniref:Uncharacterized protein n=1 Tax=Psittacicella hinzii TaxID=2028575 RepID=A0A3A1YBG9_9GAMM|nr:S24 family peptidase [Psittacicella hinzii]RIY34530.1 hypothetical protein CKF58_08125 [Psittacicella hinzii]
MTLMDFLLKLNKYPKEIANRDLNWYLMEPDKFDKMVREKLLNLYNGNEKMLFRAFEKCNFSTASKYRNFKAARFLSFCDCYGYHYDSLMLDNKYDPDKPINPYITYNPNVFTVGPYISLTKEQVQEFYSDLKDGFSCTYEELGDELRYTAHSVKANMSIIERTTVDFFNRICLRYGLRTENYKEFFEYCEEKGWVKRPNGVHHNFNEFMSQSSEVNAIYENSELLPYSEDTDFLDNEDGFNFEYEIKGVSKTAYFVNMDQLPPKSIIEVKITDDSFQPNLRPGDRIGIYKTNKFLHNGYYYITENKKLNVFSTVQLIGLIKQDDGSFIVLTGNPFLKEVRMTADEFSIVGCVIYKNSRI